MGEENNCTVCIKTNDTWQPIKYISNVEFADCAYDGKFSNLNGIWSFEMKLRVPRTKKRFKKFLMSNHVSRNEAERLTKQIAENGFSYAYAFAHITLGI